MQKIKKELEKSLGLPVTLFRYHKNHSGTIQIPLSTEEDFAELSTSLFDSELSSKKKTNYPDEQTRLPLFQRVSFLFTTCG